MTGSYEAAEYAAFLESFGQHELHVFRNDRAYRHLRMHLMDEKGRPTFVLCYDLLTWPGHLAVVGDAHPTGMVFAGEEYDMVEFFTLPPSKLGPAGPDIDYADWVDKLIGPAQNIRFGYDPNIFLGIVDEQLAAHVENGELLPRDADRFAEDARGYRHSSCAAYQWFTIPPQNSLFPDAWEYDLFPVSAQAKNLCRRVELAVRKYNEREL